MENTVENTKGTEESKTGILELFEKDPKESITEGDQNRTDHDEPLEEKNKAEKVQFKTGATDKIDTESKLSSFKMEVKQLVIEPELIEQSPTEENENTSHESIPIESFLPGKVNNPDKVDGKAKERPPRQPELDQISNDSAFENRELIQKFHAKMYRVSKVFVYAHILLSTCGAIGYSVVAISSTNEWHQGIETPGWHIPGGFIANVVMINTLAVAVNLNLCFAALLIIGFHKHNRLMIWMWYLGQLGMEMVVTCTLVLSVFYDCKLTAMLSIPPFLYYVISLSSFRQILATVSLNKSIQV